MKNINERMSQLGKNIIDEAEKLNFKVTSCTLLIVSTVKGESVLGELPITIRDKKHFVAYPTDTQ